MMSLYASLSSLAFLQMFIIQFSLAQLQELCKGVSNEDTYSRAVIQECNKNTVTVELQLKYVPIKDIAGVRFELFCNNKITVTLHDYYSQLSSNTVILKSIIDSTNLESCLLVTCYHINGESYNIASVGNCTFDKSKQIHDDIISSSINVTSSVHTVSATVASELEWATSLPQESLLHNITSAKVTQTILESTPITFVTQTRMPQSSSAAILSSHSNPPSLTEYEYQTITESPTHTSKFSMLSSMSVTVIYPLASSIVTSNYLSTQHYTTEESLSVDPSLSMTPSNSVISDSASNDSIQITQLVIIAVICAAIIIVTTVTTTVVSCSLLCVKFYRISSSKTEALQENELIHLYTIDKVQEPDKVPLSLSPSLVTIISPLVKVHVNEDDKCTVITTNHIESCEKSSAASNALGNRLSASIGDDDGKLMNCKSDPHLEMGEPIINGDVEKSSIPLNHLYYLEKNDHCNQLQMSELRTLYFLQNISGEYYDRLSYLHCYDSLNYEIV